MGDPATELIRLAEERNVDLIAMSTHGHRFFNDLLRGTTVSKVRHLVKIPVLLRFGEPSNSGFATAPATAPAHRQELQQVLFAHVLRCRRRLHWALFVDRARAARAADSSDDMRLIGVGPERQLDEVVAAWSSDTRSPRPGVDTVKA